MEGQGSYKAWQLSLVVPLLGLSNAFGFALPGRSSTPSSSSSSRGHPSLLKLSSVAAPALSSFSTPSPVVPGVEWLCTDDDAGDYGTGVAGDGTALASVERPRFDAKKYRVVELPNGLRALLVSDPTSEMAGCSMNIHAGSFQDPPGFAGLAHFHEHMMFLGTEKYPGEDEYEQFLSTNGGFSNAYTADEDTNFYFEVTAPHLSGAMDRFAQFFLCPTFAQEMVDREVRAIDSEHNNNKPEDAWRLHQVFKQSLRRGHPISGFSTGNLETLLGAPGRAVADLHAALVEFHETWYVTSRMTLTLQGVEPLDELEKMLVDTGFGKIQSGDGDASRACSPSSLSSSLSKKEADITTTLSPPGRVRRDVPRFVYDDGTNPFGEKVTVQPREQEAAAAAARAGDEQQEEEEEEEQKKDPPFSSPVVGKMRYVVPVSDRRELSLVFPLGGAVDKDAKPHRYLSHVLGHEGPNSLHALLQAKGWVEELSAGASLQYDDCSAFRISLVLTEAGEANLFPNANGGSSNGPSVLDLVFLQLALTRIVEPSAEVCDEIASMAQLDFAYQEDMPVSSFVSRSASCLYDYEPAAVLSGPMLMRPTVGREKEKAKGGEEEDSCDGTTSTISPGTASNDNGGGGGDEDIPDALVVAATLAQVKTISQRLVPENAIITFVSKSVEEEFLADTTAANVAVETPKPKAQGPSASSKRSSQKDELSKRWMQEQWYGVRYREEDISNAMLAAWQFNDISEGLLPWGTTLRATPSLNRFMPSQAEFASGLASPPPRLTNGGSGGDDNDDGNDSLYDDASTGALAPQFITLVQDESGDCTTGSRSNHHAQPRVVAVTEQGKQSVDLEDNRRTHAKDSADSSEREKRERARAWHLRPSARFGALPKTHVLVHALTPAAYCTPAQTMLCRLFVRTVLSDLNSYVYDASIAGMSYELESLTTGLVVSVTGFESQVPRLLEVILRRTASLSQQLGSQRKGTEASAAATRAAGIFSGNEHVEDAETPCSMANGVGPTSEEAPLCDEEFRVLEQRFQMQRELLLQDMRNAEKDSPYTQASYWARQCLEERVWHINEYIQVLEDDEACNLAAMGQAAAALLDRDRICFEVLVTDNKGSGGDGQGATVRDITALCWQSLRELPSRRHGSWTVGEATDENGDDALLEAPRAVQLPLEEEKREERGDGDLIRETRGGSSSATGGVLLQRVLPDETNENSCVQVHFQCGLESIERSQSAPLIPRGVTATPAAAAALPQQKGLSEIDPPAQTSERSDEPSPPRALRQLTAREQAALDLLAHLAYPSAFDTLRTKEQLGYLVSAHTSRFAGVTGLSVVVQSSAKGPRDVQQCMDAWLAAFGDELRNMPAEEVEANAQSLAALLLEKSRSMGEEHDVCVGEILSTRYDFGRRRRRAQDIRAVGKDDLLAFYDRHIAPSAPERRPLRLHFYSQNHHRAALQAQQEAGKNEKDELRFLESLGDVRSFKSLLPRYPSTSLPWWSVATDNKRQ